MQNMDQEKLELSFASFQELMVGLQPTNNIGKTTRRKKERTD